MEYRLTTLLQAKYLSFRTYASIFLYKKPRIDSAGLIIAIFNIAALFGFSKIIEINIYFISLMFSAFVIYFCSKKIRRFYFNISYVTYLSIYILIFIAAIYIIIYKNSIKEFPLYFATSLFLINAIFLTRQQTLITNLLTFIFICLAFPLQVVLAGSNGVTSLDFAQCIAVSACVIVALNLAIAKLEDPVLHGLDHPAPSEEALETSRLAIENFKIREALARMNRITVVEAMTSTISHEMSQPIGSALIFTEAAESWLSAKTPNLIEARKALAGAVSEISRAGQVLSSIRRLTARAPSRLQENDIDELVRSLTELMRPSLEQRGIRLILNQHLPADRQIVFIRPEEISQVLLNLINNSSEALAEQQDEKRVTVETGLAADGWLYLNVSDNGRGISPEQMTRIFESFYTTKPKGTGLGLSICREIAENHGGSLLIDSVPGRGTVASLRIPVV